MSPGIFGSIVGLVLGIVWMWLGFGAALLAGLLALIGWFVGRAITGNIDIVSLWNDLQGRHREPV